MHSTGRTPARGGGSLKQVRPGVWRSRVVVGYAHGDTTRPQQHSETYGSNREPVIQREAERRHARHITGASDNRLSTTLDTFGAYLDRWLDDESPRWKPTTERRNRSIVSAIPAALKRRPLRSLTTGELQRYLNRLPRAGQKRVYAVISGALNAAVTGDEVGLAANPAVGVRLPKAAAPEAHPPKDDQLESILKMARQTRNGDLWSDLFTFAAFTGLRRGELAALQWRDVNDLESVTVRHAVETLTKADGGSTWQLGSTKSHAERTVPLAQRARRAVARRRAAQGDSLAPDAFVFSVDGSAPLHPDHISKTFAKTAATVGVSTQLKDLRSYAATVLASSAGLKVAQTFLGHKDVTTTARHYTGVRDDAFSRGLAALDAVSEDVPELNR